MRLFFYRAAPFSWHTAHIPEALLEDLDTLDLEAMKVLVRTQQRKLSSHETEIAHLKLLLDKLRRMLFGAKSEKLVRQVEQLEFQLEELEAVRGEDRIAEPLPKSQAASVLKQFLSRRAARFRNICRARSRRICPRRPAARTAAARCASSART